MKIRAIHSSDPSRFPVKFEIECHGQDDLDTLRMLSHLTPEALTKALVDQPFSQLRESNLDSVIRNSYKNTKEIEDSLIQLCQVVENTNARMQGPGAPGT